MVDTKQEVRILNFVCLESNCQRELGIFSARVIAYWNCPAADTVAADSLALSKRFLHRDLGYTFFECIY